MSKKNQKNNNNNYQNNNNRQLTKKEERQLKIQETQDRKRKEREERKRFIHEKKKRQYGDAEWKSDFLKFSDQLEAIGLTIKDVAGDGNCLFRAMSDQFTGDPNNYATYRKQICDYIVLNRFDFEPFIEDDEPFEAYIARMRRNATWGGHLEIQACSMLYQVNITIHQLSQPRWDLSYPGIPYKTIHFSYHQGQHYSSVRMIGDRAGPPQPIVIQSRSAKQTNNNKSQYKEPEIMVPREEELIVMDHTGCNNIEFIRQVLSENYGDIESTVEFIFIVGPENDEFQKEYLEKPYDPDNHKPIIDNSKEKKSQNNNNKNAKNNTKPPENDKENHQTRIENIKSKMPITHETNKQRKERLKAEKQAEATVQHVPPPVSDNSTTEERPAPAVDPINNIILDLGSVQI